MMKNWYSRHIALILLATASLTAVAQEEPHDTVYFYTTWTQIFDMAPETMVVDPAIDVYSPFELYVETGDKKANKRIKNEYIAASLGDSTWLVNSNYLKENFKGDSKDLYGYVPLFFSEKVAYAVAEEYSYAELGDIAFNVVSTYNYYIDFKRHKVIKVNEKTLGNLLADYHDLRMRYESMSNSNKSAIINDFFLQFVDRATDDPMRPDITEFIDKTSTIQ